MDEHEAVENFHSEGAELQDDSPGITAARAFQDEWLRTHGGFHDQDENGIDLSLIRSNLQLSVTERIRKAQNAANALLSLKDAIHRP